MALRPCCTSTAQLLLHPLTLSFISTTSTLYVFSPHLSHLHHLALLHLLLHSLFTYSSPTFFPALPTLLSYNTPPPTLPPFPLPLALTTSSTPSHLLTALYRSAQLATTLTRFSRFGGVPPTRHFGCLALESAHHAFVQCPHFATLGDSACSRVHWDTSALLDAVDVPPTRALSSADHGLYSPMTMACGTLTTILELLLPYHHPNSLSPPQVYVLLKLCCACPKSSLHK